MPQPAHEGILDVGLHDLNTGLMGPEGEPGGGGLTFQKEAAGEMRPRNTIVCTKRMLSMQQHVVCTAAAVVQCKLMSSLLFSLPCFCGPAGMYQHRRNSLACPPRCSHMGMGFCVTCQFI
jgi:hypothetical protein